MAEKELSPQAAKAMEKLKDETRLTESQFRKLAKEMGIVGDQLEVIVEMSKKLGKLKGGVEDITDQFEALENSAHTLHGDLLKMQGLDPFKKQKDSIDKVNNTIKDIRQRLEDLRTKTSKGIIANEDDYKALKEYTKQIEDLEAKAAAMKKGGTLFSDPTDFIDGMKKSESAAKKVTGQMLDWIPANNKVGNLLRSMINVIGGVSKAVKGVPFIGWAIAIGSFIKALWDLSVELDAFQKDANKRFAMIRGPQIMTPDLEKQFKKFNDSVYSISQNIRTGLKPQQVFEFAEALAQSGFRVTQLSTDMADLGKGMHTFREAVNIAARASRNLGVDIQYAGNMLGDMLMEFRANMDDVDSLFTEVAFDAQKSGMTTDRFWTAVKNASASMAIYGIFIDAASKNLAALSKTQVAGASDIADANAEMMQTLSKNTFQANMQLLQFARDGGYNVRKGFEKAAGEWEKKAAALETQIDVSIKGGASTDQIEKLRNELAAAQEKQLQATKLMDADVVAQAANAAMLTADTGDIITAALKKAGVSNLKQLETSRNIAVAIKGLAGTGITEKEIRLLMHASGQSSKMIEGAIIDLKKVDMKFGKKNLTEMKRTVASLKDVEGSTDSDLIAETISNNSKTLKELFPDLRDEQAKTVAETIAADKNSADKLKRIMTLLAEGKMTQDEANIALDSIATDGRAADKRQLLLGKTTEIVQDSMAKTADENFKRITAQTLSLKDIMDISKEGVQWQGAMLTQTVNIAGWVSKIAEHLVRGAGASAAVAKGRTTLYGMGVDPKKSIDLLKQMVVRTEELAKINTDIRNNNAKIESAQKRAQKILRIKEDKRTDAQKEDLKNAEAELVEAQKQDKILQEQKTKTEGILTATKDVAEGTESMENLMVEQALMNPEISKKLSAAVESRKAELKVKELDAEEMKSVYSKVLGTTRLGELAYGKKQAAETTVTGAGTAATTMATGVKNDFLVTTGGWVPVKDNDIVVDAKSLASGMAKPAGALVNPAMNTMMKNASGSSSLVINQVTINAPKANLTAEDLMDAFEDRMQNEIRAFWYKTQQTSVGA